MDDFKYVAVAEPVLIEPAPRQYLAIYFNRDLPLDIHLQQQIIDGTGPVEEFFFAVYDYLHRFISPGAGRSCQDRSIFIPSRAT